jgi:hypothetical protein
MAKELAAPVELLREVAKLGRLPVVMFSAGGIATPADAALMMKLGMDGVFVYVLPSFLSAPGDQADLFLLFLPFLFFPRSQRFGHLQVIEPGTARQGHRRGHNTLQRPAQARRYLVGTRCGHEG